MRVLLSILITVAIGMGTYALYMKSTIASTGGTPVQVISTTTVKMQLLNIAQAEKAYFLQNNAYGTIADLSSSGWLTLKTPDPTGYGYTAETTPDGFRVTAQHGDAGSATSKNYPTMSIDQNMKVEGSN